MTPEQKEVLLEKADRALQSLLPKAALSLLAILGAALAAKLGDTWPVRILLAVCTLELVLIGFLCVRLFAALAREKRNATTPRKDSAESAALLEPTVSILCVLSDSQPDEWSVADLARVSRKRETDVEASLACLLELGFASLRTVSIESQIVMGFPPHRAYRGEGKGTAFLKKHQLR